MSIENSPENPNEEHFNMTPEDKERKNDNVESKIDDKEIEKANEKLEMKQQKQIEEEKESNNEFLESHQGLSELAESYEEKIGNAFTEQKEEIIKNLREFADKKTEVNMENPQEKQMSEDTLKEKLEDEVKQRFNPAT